VFANFTVGEIYLDIATSAKPLTERIYSSNTALGTHAECNIRDKSSRLDENSSHAVDSARP
jgi:hypothetical protein